MVIVGVGVLLPILLQVLLLGRPAMMLTSPQPDGDSETFTIFQLATLAGLVIQTGSFVAAWRIGFGRSATLGGALLYGLVAGLMVSIGLGLAVAAAAAVFGLVSASLGGFAVLVVFVGLFAIAWTAFAALLAMALCVGFALTLAIGLITGNLSVAATMFGGNGVTGSILVAAALVLLWLSARLSCTTALMAERRSFNFVAAMRESWSLTWDDEWRITRYLALVGLAMALLLFLGLLAVGSGVGAGMGISRGLGPGIGPGILLVAMPIPLAYLSVLVPAGIYRELAPADVATAEVFA
jgi:hypothetical protein